jgi:hypothetical protein
MVPVVALPSMAASNRNSKLHRFYLGLALFCFNTFIFLLVVNLVASLYLAASSRGSTAKLPGYVTKAMDQVYADWPAEDRRQLELESRHDHVADMLVQFREKPLAGKFVTIDPHGYRVGAEQSPWPIDEAYTNIFFFGGSTAVGYGVKDADTIASRVHARLAEAGLERPPRVYNFGRGAFYSTQERLLFDKMITFGETPDMAIFLDGLNDFFYFEDPPILTEMWTARVKREAAHPILASLERLPVLRVLRSFGVTHVFERHDSRSRKSQGRGTQPDGRKKKLKDTGLDDSAKARRVIDRYLANKRIVDAIAASRDVPAVFVWQPVPTYKYDLQYHVFDGDFKRHELSRVGYPMMRERIDAEPAGDNFLWCADLQEHSTELLYVDLVHYSPAMSDEIARCIVDGIVERGLLR